MGILLQMAWPHACRRISGYSGNPPHHHAGQPTQVDSDESYRRDLMGAVPKVGVRWTIGDVSEPGFEALRPSICGAWQLFGPDAAYAVCSNSIPLEQARAWTGPLPEGVIWQDATDEMPNLLKTHLDPGWPRGRDGNLRRCAFSPIGMCSRCITTVFYEPCRRRSSDGLRRQRRRGAWSPRMSSPTVGNSPPSADQSPGTVASARPSPQGLT
jgi:hypothetical protein